MRRTVIICSLVGIFAFVSTTLAQEKAELEFVSANKCKLCHNKPAEGAQWTKWKAMKHANAFEVLSSERALEVAKKTGLNTPPSESSECLQCHVTGYDFETKTLAKGLKMADGVQCDSCHGRGSGHLIDGKALRMNKGAGLDVMANLVLPDANTCVKCHNDRNPTWNPEKYALPSGEKVGFDFAQAFVEIAHSNPLKADAKK